tara:strand:- start:321 stop:713 length:393 start_codon:yes stop_codon:yes gene_type:complete
MTNKITKKTLRDFGYLVGIGFPLIIGFIIPLITGHGFRFWTLFISFPAILFGIFDPYKLKFFYKRWMALGHILGWLNSKIILGLVFLLVVQPIAFIMKLFGYDPLKKKKHSLYSYREEKVNSKIDLTRIF